MRGGTKAPIACRGLVESTITMQMVEMQVLPISGKQEMSRLKVDNLLLIHINIRFYFFFLKSRLMHS